VSYFRQVEGEQRTTALELFFDLVFVFAVTQLSHLLLNHLTVKGTLQTLFLLLVVWWAWIYTTWMTNFFDPDAVVVRLVLIVVMLASLMMAIAIPEAFGDHAVMFAAGYTALQVIRNAFVFRATPLESPLRRAFVGIFIWSLAAGALWLAGAFTDDRVRVGIWLAVLFVDYLGPVVGYWLPGRGRSLTFEWSIESSHFAERFQLFIIIALGESIVVTGATASTLPIDLARAAAIAVAFLTSAALWWLYFDFVARISQRRLDVAEDRGRMARDAFTYIHIPIVAGIIVAAVGDELVIAHPGASLSAAELAAVASGPALYLLGHVAFRLRLAGSLSGKRLAAALAILAVGALGAVVTALATATLILVVLVVLIVSEGLAGRRRRLRGEPGLLERIA
jgi:low temperature requirement protein LtrA